MGRILVQTVVLLALALGAGFVHSKVVTVHPRLPDQAPLAAPSGPTSPVLVPAATGNTPPFSSSGPSGATGQTGAKAPSAPTTVISTPVVPTPPQPEPPKPAPPKAATSSNPAENWFITVEQAKAIYDKNEAVFVDARTFDEYREGHVPNSMHMDKKYFDGAAGAMKAKNLKGQAVVIYCHGAECTDSQAVATRFISLNYQIGPIHIIKEGFPGWQKAGYPVDKGNEVNW